MRDSESDKATGTPIIASLQRTKSIEALAMDSRLDKLSEWVKGVERMFPHRHLNATDK